MTAFQPARSGNANVFETFGVRPVVNCCGIYTDLGGSILSPAIWRALEELNGSFVRMTDLLDAASAMIADVMESEAARITPGASAAIVLAVAATMTGVDGRRWEQLPDTRGMRNEAILAAAHLPNYKYASCARMSGATLIAAGPPDRFDLGAMIDAITPRTACILVPAHLLDGYEGVGQLTALVAAAHAREVPVVVDAAYMSYPVALLRMYAQSGADLTCFSAKYFGGPNSGGFVSGSAALIRAVEGLDFTRYESGEFRIFGRPFKMSRYDVAATALALRDWAAADHEARWKGYAAKVDRIAGGVPDLPGIAAKPRFFTMDEALLESDTINCLVLEFGPDAQTSAAAVARILEEGNPIVAAIVEDDKLIVAVDGLVDGQEDLVAARLRSALTDATAEPTPQAGPQPA